MFPCNAIKATLPSKSKKVTQLKDQHMHFVNL